MEEQTTEQPSDENDAESAQDLGEAPAETQDSIEQTGTFLKGLIEALLFVSDRPLELKEVARGARIDRARASELLEEIRKEYEGRGIHLDEVGGGFAFRSSPMFAERVRQYLALRPVRLSRAQLETLAIVAYRQPITRPEIDDVRGVDSGPVLKGLLERDLIRIIGKKDEPGRPMLYGTTPVFLEAFSLKSLRDLPTLREYTELSEESRQTFEAELGESAPDDAATLAAGLEAAGAESDGVKVSEDDEPSPGSAELEAGEGAAAADEPNSEDDEKPAAGEESEEADDDDDDDDDDDEDDDDDDDDDDEDDDEDDDKKK